MDRDNRIAAIVLAAQHLAGLGLLDVRLEVVETFGEVAVNRLTGLGPLDEDAEIVGAARQGLTGSQLFVEAATALQQLLRLAGILPEIGVGDATLDLASSARWPGSSKIAPQIDCPFHEILVSTHLLFEDERHATLL